MFETIGIILGSLLIILILVVLVRTLLFVPKKRKAIEGIPLNFPADEAITSLQEMIQCKTISHKNEVDEDMGEFLKFEARLQKNFPQVHAHTELLKIGNKSLLYKWSGKQSTNTPTVLMSHYDVVPANEELWEVDPFSGLIKDGYLWGRGTLDTKATLNGIMSAAETLIKQGFVPENDIYFAFAGNEEVAGTGAPLIVQYFEKKHITPKLVVDEGGAIVEKIFPGVSRPCALVGIAEKGMLEIELVLKSNGGHASAPKPHTSVGELAQACVNVEAKPFPKNLSIPAKRMFDILGRESSFIYRMIFANLWLFSGLLDALCKKNGGELNALMRTTMAFTQMEGSKANNVIHGGDSIYDVIHQDQLDHLQKIYDN
ncbi:MAG: M20/M25/M40 family metallo-hydrolase, partial [Bacilli bacterium]|nr:M20/M25/M40 family metallo-hydrolase [Bacilli bacterium]